MNPLPPLEEDWSKALISLDGKGGGVLTIGTANYHIRNWQKLNAGQVAFETQGERDPAFEELLAQLDARARAI